MEARRLVLASASPRRRALLEALGLRFDVVPSDLEEPIPEGMLPAGVAVSLALDKAAAVHAVHRDAVVLGADTLVVGGDLRDPSGVVYYGKPADARDAVRMLEELSGQAHYVITGAAVVWSGGGGDTAPVRCRAEAATTRVRFRKLSPEEIEAYVATGEPMDKAGAYAIQGGASAFVESVVGDYYNVVGLSLASARRLLRGLVGHMGPVPPVPELPFPIARAGRGVR